MWTDKEELDISAARRAHSEYTGRDVGKDKFNTIIQGGALSPTPDGRLLLSDIKRLAQLPNYTRVPAQEIRGQYVHIVVSITSEELDGTLELSEANGRKEALHMLTDKSRADLESGNLDITGWWRISPERVRSLIEQGALILGVAGGYVVAAGRIKSEVGRIHYQNRVALLIEPLQGEELDSVRGYVEGTNQAVLYVKPLENSAS